MTLPKCRFGCYPAVIFIELGEKCLCYPNDKKQWLCAQHFVRQEQSSDVPHEVIADVVSLGWIQEILLPLAMSNIYDGVISD